MNDQENSTTMAQSAFVEADQPDLQPYVVVWESELKCIASLAACQGETETGGEAYGLLSHAGRPVITLVTPPGPAAIQEVAHLATQSVSSSPYPADVATKPGNITDKPSVDRAPYPGNVTTQATHLAGQAVTTTGQAAQRTCHSANVPADRCHSPRTASVPL